MNSQPAHNSPLPSNEYVLAGTFGALGQYSLNLLGFIGGVSQLTGTFFKTLVISRFPLRETVRQFELIGIRSLTLTNLIALFTGLVIALQFIVGLERFGLQIYTGQVVSIAIVRELGPVLTALMVAARVGAGITAELGSMTVTEQVLAIEAMGANPVQRLVVPRVIATTLCTPILAIIADFVGILGSMLMTMYETGIDSAFYLDQIRTTVEMEDFSNGIYKTFFFGFLVGMIACYQGLSTRGGTEGVGRSTTYSVVYSAMTIFIADFFLTKFFLAI